MIAIIQKRTRPRPIQRMLIVLIGALLMLTAAFFRPLIAEDLQFTAAVDRMALDRSQTFTLTLQVEGSISSAPEPKLPDLSDFRVISGPNESSTFQIINGRYSLIKSWRFVLKPQRAGELTIGPAELTHKGQTYHTEPITLTVTGAGAPPPSATQPGTPPPTTAKEPLELFVKVTADKQRIYQNEQVVLTYTIYTRVSVNSYEISRLPSTPGFWTEEFDIPDPPRVLDETISGRHYRKALIRKVALFPTRSGNLSVDPLEVTCHVQVEDKSRRRRDPFDMLFDSPFMRYRTEERFIETKPLSLTVQPLPAKGKTESFTGAVGDFSLEVALDREQVKTNEALTMTVRFSGTGNVKLLGKPQFKAPPDFESYEPKEAVRVNKSGNRITGTKTYEYVLIPRVPGPAKIQPLEFTYFDPNSRSYKTVTRGGFEIDVQQGEGAVTTSLPGIAKEDVRLLAEDIHYLKTPGRLLQMGNPYQLPGIYWIGMILPQVLTLLLWWGARLMGAPTLQARRRSRLVYTSAKRELQAVSRSASSPGTDNDAAKTCGAIQHILLGYLGRKMNMPASGLKEDEVLRRLAQHAVSRDLLTDLQEIFEECNVTRFAPRIPDNSLLNRLIKRAHRTLDTLETNLGTQSNGKLKAAGTAILVLTGLAVMNPPAYAQDAVTATPDNAAELYRSGDYTEAASAYEKMINQGWQNGELYYNLGNCYYKLGEYGPAILNYERARRYLGNDPELHINLKLANLRIYDRIEPLPRIFIFRIFEGIGGLFTVRAWAAFFLISEWLVFAALIGLNALRRPVWRKFLARGFLLFVVIAVISGAFFFEQKIYRDNLVEAVVLQSSVEVRSAPEAGSTELFALHEGTKVRILRRVSGWAEIHLADGKRGWMPEPAYEII